MMTREPIVFKIGGDEMPEHFHYGCTIVPIKLKPEIKTEAKGFSQTVPVKRWLSPRLCYRRFKR